jgi:hypothetical protein
MKSITRHQYAYRVVTKWSPTDRESAVEIAQGYPIELRTSGIMQTLAFSMDRSAHKDIARAIADWVLSEESGAPVGKVPQGARTPEELLKRLAEASRARYLAADSEAIAFADAIKLLVKALKGRG